VVPSPDVHTQDGALVVLYRSLAVAVDDLRVLSVREHHPKDLGALAERVSQHVDIDRLCGIAGREDQLAARRHVVDRRQGRPGDDRPLDRDDGDGGRRERDRKGERSRPGIALGSADVADAEPREDDIDGEDLAGVRRDAVAGNDSNPREAPHAGRNTGDRVDAVEGDARRQRARDRDRRRRRAGRGDDIGVRRSDGRGGEGYARDLRRRIRIGIRVRISTRVGVGVGIGIGVGVGIGVGIDISIGVGVGVGVGIDIRIDVRIRVRVGISVRVSAALFSAVATTSAGG
jgi:hypothetical protein